MRRGRYEYDIEAGRQQAGNILAEVYFRGKTAENRAAGQFTVPPLCFSAGMSCSCVMASHDEVGFVNILHAKAVCFFGT